MFQVVPGIHFILASSSPRRQDLLASVGIKFSVKVSGADEALVHGESAESMVKRLALRKAWSVAESDRDAWTLGADTTVVVNGEILGKPSDAEEAVSMLFKLSAQPHEVVGAFALVCPARAVEHVEVHRTRVKFATLSDAMKLAYVQSGEPFDKAGGYAAQGLGASLVEEMHGSYTNVVGLNLSATLGALQKFGVIQVAPSS